MPHAEQTAFRRRAREKAGDETHRLKILKAISSYDAAVQNMKIQQWQDWQRARAHAARIKEYVLENLPALLQEFEQNISSRGAEVLWAETAEEARRLFMQIAAEHHARKIVKSKSMTTEEIELNDLLEKRGIEVWESDLGELIVQLAGEKPYHIVTPAMHKSKAEISTLFRQKLDAPETDNAEELTAAARAHLREAYVTADIGVTGANFLIAREGAVVMTENEGNGRLSMSCPPVHVVIAGIEKVLPRLQDLAVFLPLLSTTGTGQQVTCYNSIVRGPKLPGEPDGPEKLYVILLDNGRSTLYADATFRQALRCIRCGACLNACPVFRTIGGHAYGTTYQGPIGSVITPHLRDLNQFHHLPYASSLCGACTDSCPVKIDLHHLLLENRWRAARGNAPGILWRLAMAGWAFAMANRTRLNLLRSFARVMQPLFRLWRKNVPRLAARSFNQLWEERHE